MAVIVKPASVFSIVTAAEVRIDSAVMPAFPSWPESAIEKQPACAAPISSSGFVPFSFSRRVVKDGALRRDRPSPVLEPALPDRRRVAFHRRLRREGYQPSARSRRGGG